MIQLTKETNFISSKDTDEECVMHSQSDNIEIMINEKVDKVIKVFFQLLLFRCQIGLETLKEGSQFVFGFVQLLYYKCHKIRPYCGGSYIDSADWIKSKRATIKSINKKHNKCFQYAITVALNHQKIKDHPERITKIKPFTAKYHWEIINYPSEKHDWKKGKKIIQQLLLMFYMLKITKYILPTFENITQSVKNKLLI